MGSFQGGVPPAGANLAPILMMMMITSFEVNRSFVTLRDECSHPKINKSNTPVVLLNTPNLHQRFIHLILGMLRIKTSLCHYSALIMIYLHINCYKSFLLTT